MEILYRVIAAITSVLLGAMIAGGIGVVSAVVSAPFKLFGLAGIIIAYVLITPIATLVGAIAGGAVAGPFEVARYRYYLSLRKNGIRPKVTCIFDAFDFFMQFALVTGVRMLTIMWIPVLIQFATLLLAAVVAAASRSYLAAMLLVMIGMIAALVVAAYRSYQFWPMALVQADHPQLNAEQVMERCKVMTEGHKFDLFVFDLSYLGWNILSLLTGGILSVLYVAPYKMMATAFVYEEMKGRPVMVDDIKPSTDGNGMTIAVDPKKLMGIGSTGGKKPTSHIPAASRAAGAALEGVAGMYAGSSYPLEPNQPVILGRDPAYAKIVFSQGAQKISRRHCEVMFNSQVQKYRVTDFSSNALEQVVRPEDYDIDLGALMPKSKASKQAEIHVETSDDSEKMCQVEEQNMPEPKGLAAFFHPKKRRLAYLELTMRKSGGHISRRRWIIEPNRTVKVGRLATSDVMMPADNQISRNHCEVFYNEPKREFIVRDLSKYGTYLADGKPMEKEKSYTLKDGDIFCVVSPEYTFKVVIET